MQDHKDNFHKKRFWPNRKHPEAPVSKQLNALSQEGGRRVENLIWRRAFNLDLEAEAIRHERVSSPAAFASAVGRSQMLTELDQI